MLQKIQDAAFRRPYAALFLGVCVLFSIFAVQGLSFAYIFDYYVYISVAQNLFHGGVLYKDAIDTKNAGFFFLFYYLIYCPYALLFATTEFLYLWHAFVLTAWYTALSCLVFAVLSPLYGTGKALFSGFAFQLFLLGNRHSLFFNQPQAGLLFVFLLALVLVRTAPRQNLADYTLYGLLLGFCFLVSSPYALLVFTVPVLAAQKFFKETAHRKRRFVLRGLCAAAGFLLALAPAFWYFFKHQALADWYFWNFTFPTQQYYTHSEFYALSFLQVLPLFALLPYGLQKDDPSILRRSIRAYLACFAALALIVFLILLLGGKGLFQNGAWDLSFLGSLENSDNLFVRLTTKMYDIPWKTGPAKYLLSFVSLFAGNSILIAHTPQIIYHYFLLDTVLLASGFAFFKKKYPPLPLLCLGIGALAGRLNLARSAGSDTYNLYLVPLVVLWLPFVLEVFKEKAFPQIHKAVLLCAFAAALAHIPLWSALGWERHSSYPAEVKAIVAANPDKAPVLVSYPWVYSYSTLWKQGYYNQYIESRPRYEDKINQLKPEAVLVWSPLQWREYDPRIPEMLSEYQQVSFDAYGLFIRKDALDSWVLPSHQ